MIRDQRHLDRQRSDHRNSRNCDVDENNNPYHIDEGIGQRSTHFEGDPQQPIPTYGIERRGRQQQEDRSDESGLFSMVSDCQYGNN